jgi:hypothetical protein
MSNEQKLELGIEVISAMKASAYNTDIETGRLMALEDTELDKLGTHSFEEYEKLDSELKERIKNFQISQKENLHKQALFIADIVIQKYNSLTI